MRIISIGEHNLMEFFKTYLALNNLYLVELESADTQLHQQKVMFKWIEMVVCEELRP